MRIDTARSIRRVGRLAVFVLAGGTAFAQDAPMPTVDWLSFSVATPARPLATDPPVTASAAPPTITVTPLDRPLPDSVGLIAPADAGIGQGIWTASTTATLSRQLAALSPPRSTAMQGLMHDLLRLRADAPRNSTNGEAFFLARIDALLAFGRFDTARELMARAGSEAPPIFRRWFDVTLLTGGETRACARMRALPEITPTYPARIFCLARTGDWPAAVVTLETARALGVITPAETQRLTRFLDDRADPGLLPPPARPTPLDFYLYEAMGESLRSPVLPLPFAHADLRANTGWKPRIAAGERLARAGGIGHDRLWAIYAERKPAASGAPWDRVDRVQQLEQAMRTGNADAVAQTLPPAWDAMAQAGLLAPLVDRYAARLARLPLQGRAADLARRTAALAGRSVPDLDGPAGALSRGDIPQTDPTDPVLLALIAGLTDPPPAAAQALIAERRTGEALLDAVRLVDAGTHGNLDALSDGMAILRAAGQPDRARAVAIEALLTGWDN